MAPTIGRLALNNGFHGSIPGDLVALPPQNIQMFSEKQLQRYKVWTGENTKFTHLFAIAIFFPVAPDDLLCYLAGTTAMSWRQFICIICWENLSPLLFTAWDLQSCFSLSSRWADSCEK